MRHRSGPALAALLITILWHGHAIAAEPTPPVHDCDRLAADPFDPDKIVAGVRIDQLDAAKALAACAVATRAFPEVARFELQYARAFTKAERYADAEKYWRRFSDEGYPIAQFYMGRFFAEGRGSFSKNEAEAVRYFNKAAEQGYPPAEAYLGTIYAQGQGVSQDYSTALGWFRKAAARGEPVAQNWLGSIYAQGLGGVSQDQAEAAKWFQKAAEQDQPHAQAWLGRMYVLGQGVPQDYDKAVSILKRAAEQGEPSAQNLLGWLYENGKGVAPDLAEARRWYQNAAAQGDAAAKASLSRLGPATGGAASPKSAEPPVHDCDRLAANPEDSRAVARGVPERDLDVWGAIRACQAALDQFPNTPRFQTQIGRAIHILADRSPPDKAASVYQKAAGWYRLAAEQGYPNAMSALGSMYLRGPGVPQDYAQAEAWYRKAAYQGDAHGQNQLGIMYSKGLGVRQDYVQAVAWYRPALQRTPARPPCGTKLRPANSPAAVRAHGCTSKRGYSALQPFPVRLPRELEEAEARLTSLKAFEPFLDQAGAKQWVAMNDLVVNPFVYQDERVAVATTFETMLARDQALFSHGGLAELMGELFTKSGQTLSRLAEFLVVSNIPAGRFTRGGEWVLLVGRVDGKEYVKFPMGGELLLTHLEYVDARACQRARCE